MLLNATGSSQHACFLLRRLTPAAADGNCESMKSASAHRPVTITTNCMWKELLINPLFVIKY